MSPALEDEFFFNHWTTREVPSLLILERRKTRHREGECPVQGHTGRKWQNRDETGSSGFKLHPYKTSDHQKGKASKYVDKRD